MRGSFLLVMTTLPTRAKARSISRLLLKNKVAACVNLLGPIESAFWWEGKIDRAREYLLLIKTRTSCFERLRRLLEKKHPYSVPEIVSVAISKGNPSYLRWIRKSVR